MLWEPLRRLNGTINITSSRFRQLGIAMTRTFRKQNEQVYISSYDYHIVSIWQFDCRNNVLSCISVLFTLKYQCSLNSWMAMFFTKSGEFEHWTETVLPSSLILYFFCYIFIWDNMAVCMEMFLMQDTCVLHRLLDDQCLLQKNIMYK